MIDSLRTNKQLLFKPKTPCFASGLWTRKLATKYGRYVPYIDCRRYSKLKDINIRKAHISDRSTLLKLEQKVIEAERPYNSIIKSNSTVYYDIDNLLIDDASNLIVAEFKGEIVGTGYAQIRTSKKSLEHGTHSYLGFMYVSEDHRGFGINKLILEHLIKWSKERGILDLYLDVYEGNNAAIRAYEKVGFTNSLIEMKINLEE